MIGMTGCAQHSHVSPGMILHRHPGHFTRYASSLASRYCTSSRSIVSRARIFLI